MFLAAVAKRHLRVMTRKLPNHGGKVQVFPVTPNNATTEIEFQAILLQKIQCFLVIDVKKVYTKKMRLIPICITYQARKDSVIQIPRPFDPFQVKPSQKEVTDTKRM